MIDSIRPLTFWHVGANGLFSLFSPKDAVSSPCPSLYRGMAVYNSSILILHVNSWKNCRGVRGKRHAPKCCKVETLARIDNLTLRQRPQHHEVLRRVFRARHCSFQIHRPLRLRGPHGGTVGRSKTVYRASHSAGSLQAPARFRFARAANAARFRQVLRRCPTTSTQRQPSQHAKLKRNAPSVPRCSSERDPFESGVHEQKTCARVRAV